MTASEKRARLVLKIYAHFNSEAGQVLRANNFLAVAAKQGISVSDLQEGIDYARDKHWIETTDNGSLRLTVQGRKCMPVNSY